MAITTRRATVDDAEAIALAHMRAWQDAYRGIISDEYLGAMDLERRTEHWRDNLAAETLPNGLPSPTDYVAEVEGQVAGFVNVGVWREMPTDASLAEVWAIYVHPDHWGAGAGYELMQAAVADMTARKVATCYLWVLEANALARRFYERQGWSVNDATQEEEIGGATIIERRYSLDLNQN